MSAALTAQSAPRPRTAPERAPEHYVLIPTRLIADCRATPQAIGVYALIGRRYLIDRAPIPLSAADLMRYDPAISYGQAVRALDDLTDRGWLIKARGPGRKSHYAPTWGRVAGEVRPWAFDAPQLGRPRHVATLRLDRRLLDLLLGQIIPHPRQTALVSRYLTAPALRLADVGAYALGLTGLPVDTPALARLGLVRDRRPAPLPADDDTVLARASQLPLITPGGAALSPRGLARLGFTLAADDAPGQPLIFVPEDAGVIAGVIAQVIDDPITCAATGAVAFSAPERDPSCTVPADAASAGSPAMASDQRQPPPNPPRHDTGPSAGGGDDAPAAQETGGAGAAAPLSESTSALQAIGVRPSVASELADTPIALVQDVIADARRRPSVRDRAGWVVSRLRDARERGWQLAPATDQAPAPAAPVDELPEPIAALAIDRLLAHAQEVTPPARPALAPVDGACHCDGSGVYLLPVPYGHPLWGKLQPCTCQHATHVESALTRDAGETLAAADLARVQVTARPYAPLTWATRTFTPEVQESTLCHAASACARAAAALGRGVTLIGPPGSGKTTLAVAAAKALAVRYGLAVRYASAPQLVADLRREVSDRQPAALLAKLCGAPVLVLDDLGRESLTPFAREQLYRLLDERLRCHTPDSPRVTFITSNKTFAELYALDSAIASRIAAHTEVALCVASDYRLHAAETQETTS